MRKTVTFVLLIIAIIAGGSVADAKKTKKKASSTAKTVTISPTGNSNESITIDLFVTPEYDDQWGNMLVFRDMSQIVKDLSKMGFTTTKTTKTIKEEICGGIERYKADFYNSTRTDKEGKIIINMDGRAEPYIIFPSSAAKDKFIEGAKAAGFHYEGDGFYQGPSDCYYNGTDLQVEGNKVSFIIRWEC